MRPGFKIVTLLAVCWLGMPALLCAAEPKCEVVTKRADDRVEFVNRDEQTTISVRSPFGIGSAVVTRVADAWPERMALRLRLKGLENLKVSNGKTEFVGELVGADKRRFLRAAVDADRKELPDFAKLSECEIRAVGSDGKPSKQVPLIDGYFEVQLPRMIFADNPKSITIHWVDFYR